LNKNGFVPGEYIEIKAEVNIVCPSIGIQ